MEFLCGSEEERSARYISGRRLGEGAFGEVRLATDSFTGQKVAQKSVRITNRDEDAIPRAVFRELESLRQLSGSGYVTSLLDYYTKETSLVLVLEYLPSDLQEVISQAKEFLPSRHIKSFSKMILEAVGFCHSRNIIHRDIKPSNILLTSQGQLKLGDFGLARVIDPKSKASISHQVATRWYRAPELLFAARRYSFPSDIWSVAAVIAELIMLKPLFPGSGDIDQIFKVIQVMGTPTPENWPGVDELPDFNKVSFPPMEPVDLPLLMPHADLRDVEFLRTMLRLDPAQRVTAQQACNDSYFTEYPLPSRLSELPVPSRDKGEKRIDREAGTGAVILKDRKEVEEFLSKMIRQPVVHS